VEQLARHLGVYAGLVIFQKAAQQREVLAPPEPSAHSTRDKKEKKRKDK
jgi:hypothetical protein